MINKDDLRNAVELYYRTNFRIFTINSVDGKKVIKSPGEFISLGITTSDTVIKTVMEVIKSELPEYEVVKAEMVSVKNDSDVFKYLNYITKKGDIDKYENTVEVTGKLLDRDLALEELENLRNMIPSDLNKVNELSKLIQKLEYSVNGWEDHFIEKQEDGTYVLYHKLINYKVDGDKEYRVGIYVVEKSK